MTARRKMNGRFTESNRNVKPRPVFLRNSLKGFAVLGNDKNIPPAVYSAEPERELEQEVKRNPNNSDAKVDLGSDESMDASDPSAAAQPGCSDEPVPSSGFPE